MTVKNVEHFHGKTESELRELTTRHLLEILESARGHKICSCGKGHHCGDDVLTEDEQVWNEAQYDLFTKVKAILSTREHVPIKSKHAPVPEKKQMRY